MNYNKEFWSLPVIAGIGIGIPVTTAFILKSLNPQISFLFVILAMIISGILGFVVLVGLHQKAREAKKEEVKE